MVVQGCMEKLRQQLCNRNICKEGMKILLKYYGKVPMQWVVTKKVTDTSNPVILKLPKRLLMCLLYPVRKKIVEECLKGIENAQNDI